jgi:histone-binding protein RBBP4
MEAGLWEANRGFIYDVMLFYALEWPSLSVDWLPKFKSTSEDTEIHYLLCTTHTSGQEQEYLIQLEVHIPCKDIATEQVCLTLSL